HLGLTRFHHQATELAQRAGRQDLGRVGRDNSEGVHRVAPSEVVIGPSPVHGTGPPTGRQTPVVVERRTSTSTGFGRHRTTVGVGKDRLWLRPSFRMNRSSFSSTPDGIGQSPGLQRFFGDFRKFLPLVLRQSRGYTSAATAAPAEKPNG